MTRVKSWLYKLSFSCSLRFKYTTKFSLPKIACPAIVYAEIVVVIGPFVVGVCPWIKVYRYNPTEICQQRLQGVRNVAQKLCSWERSFTCGKMPEENQIYMQTLYDSLTVQKSAQKETPTLKIVWSEFVKRKKPVWTKFVGQEIRIKWNAAWLIFSVSVHEFVPIYIGFLIHFILRSN